MSATATAIIPVGRQPKAGLFWYLPAWVLGVFWLVVGAMKLSLMARGALEGSYLAEFPVFVIGAVALGEIAIGLAITAGRERVGLVAAMVMLGGFCVVLVVQPIPSGVPCGCTGVGGIDAIESSTAIWRNGLLLALHLLAMVCVLPRRNAHEGF